MHKLSSAFVLGYHGCDRRVAETILAGTPFNASQNDYDWLGHGVYFWEANPLRGLEFVRIVQAWRESYARLPLIEEPYVIGAVIDLGFCLDLFSSLGTQAVFEAHKDFEQYCARAGVTPPQNTNGNDAPFRRLDCAVINHLHTIRKAAGLQAFDSVKGAFIEGGPLYAGSGFYQKTHTQICVRNLECIKGVFRVPDDQLAP